ncbi:hypothetical protein A4A49_01311 [Nicotiana attenuata]|uniref:Retroviral polymerase SH3-like domain-containing protein n=1 Tax=Nicotiana attenuata TaxID=49451 RepID=A0A1J6ITD3_NICAT|nr:hypothetical protein A4A49_01311 [Nicotiana attenuata]
MERQKLLQFLMGLNESYEQARSQLLMMVHVPTVNKAYSMLMERESQRNMTNTISAADNADITALMMAKGGPYFTPELYSQILKLLKHDNTGESSANMAGIDEVSANMAVVMMGYSESTKGYILYDLDAHTFFINRDVIFKETLFPFKFKKGRPSPLFSDGGLSCPILPDHNLDDMEGEIGLDDLEISQLDNDTSPVQSARADPEADIPIIADVPLTSELSTEAVMEDSFVIESAHEEACLPDAMPSTESTELRRLVRTKRAPVSSLVRKWHLSFSCIITV